MERKCKVSRRTKETELEVTLNLDGTGIYEVSTGIGFLDHMLELFALHGNFDLYLRAKGDLDVDLHHIVEDTGLAMGEALREALGEKKGISRYGYSIIPMDEALCLMAIDLSGRPHFSIKGRLSGRIGDFDVDLVRDFFIGFVNESRITLHIHIISGRNLHHKVESIFKAFGRSLWMACRKTEMSDIPSTKGVL